MQNSETKNCQECNQSFAIESEDFNFYKKISVLPPTFCPECRFIRRIRFRNEINLYKRQCDLCKKQIISVYSADAKFPVYCNSCWFSDQWSGSDYALSINFSIPFLEQIKTLLDKVPHLALAQLKNVNSEYSNYSAENKNCYLVVSTLQSEDCAYSARLFYSRDCLDCLDISNCERCYECIRVDKSSNSTHCGYSESLVNCHYCFDCRGLIDCFGCVGLRNKSHHWLNEAVSKEEYERRKALFRNNPSFRKDCMQKYEKLLKTIPRRYAYVLKSINCVGDNITQSKNCRNCFFIKNAENAKYVFTGGTSKDFMDVSYDDDSELDYEVMSGERDYRVIFATNCWYSRELTYSNFCTDSSNLFGCVGLRNKEYCILNRKYSKEEYENLVPKITQHMNDMVYKDENGKTYSFGEFFPPDFSPFAYNETVAQTYFPLTESEAVRRGYKWKSSAERNYTIDIKAKDIPSITEIEESILSKTIECAHGGKCTDGCATAFRIIPMEFQFYKKMEIPIPELCPNCRYAQRLKSRNPMKLWSRSCQCAGAKNDNNSYANSAPHPHGTAHCSNKFETSYSPERPEIVYCESCYNTEVV